MRALIKVAEIDAMARGIDDRLQGIPAELEERRSAVRALEMLVERQRAAIVEAERLLKQQDADILSRNEGLSKAKGKSAKARTMRESEAAERELEAIRRTIKDGEVEKERLKEQVAQTTASLDAPMQTLEEQKAELAAAEQASEAKLSELRIEREKIVIGRDEWARKIDKQYLRLYDRLRTKLVPAVCEVAAETCTGCRMQMPPQRFIQLQKGTEIMQCQMCNRIVYHRDIVAD
ncbi:MAG: C4-type zinc ribbon domain-containing protein [Myxococcota bacterium]|nr:C4-type zinc ribbon domain-containing protein [Myxococcota bacterium]